MQISQARSGQELEHGTHSVRRPKQIKYVRRLRNLIFRPPSRGFVIYIVTCGRKQIRNKRDQDTEPKILLFLDKITTTNFFAFDRVIKDNLPLAIVPGHPDSHTFSICTACKCFCC